jgi:hypothetical protein
MGYVALYVQMYLSYWQEKNYLNLEQSMLSRHSACVIEKSMKLNMKVLTIHLDLWFYYNKASEKAFHHNDDEDDEKPNTERRQKKADLHGLIYPKDVLC